MTIVIDVPTPDSPFGISRYDKMDYTIETASTTDFLDATLGDPKRYHYLSDSSLGKYRTVNMPPSYLNDYEGATYPVPTVSLGIRAIHEAFAAHVPLELTPDFMWYMIVEQVGTHVKLNSNRYAKLFTDTPGAKQTILIRDDSLSYDQPSDWGRTIRAFREPLHDKLSPGIAELFLPNFSTSTIETETVLLVALMDAASPFYDYRVMTRCGIPQIRLEGETDDWYKLYNRTDELSQHFSGLADYFRDLLKVLKVIADTAAGKRVDDSFWSSIYKYNNGSGGARVTGWITAFFAHVQTPDGPQPKTTFDWVDQFNGWGGFSTNEFPSHISRVPFIWDYHGTEYNMAFAAGVTGVELDDDTFLAPKLGYAVVEL